MLISSRSVDVKPGCNRQQVSGNGVSRWSSHSWLSKEYDPVIDQGVHLNFWDGRYRDSTYVAFNYPGVLKDATSCPEATGLMQCFVNGGPRSSKTCLPASIDGVRTVSVSLLYSYSGLQRSIRTIQPSKRRSVSWRLSCPSCPSAM